MATIHTGTTMVPGKLDLLADWLPRQPWYRPTGRPPELTRAGGFRLDDPAGDVGIEFVFVTDGGASTYSVPLAYRDAPLPGAEAGLVGTSEHGVLGRRWIYDAAHDPVAVGQLLAFVSGAAEAQHQNSSDTLDPTVGRHWRPAGRPVLDGPPRVTADAAGRTAVAVESTDPPGTLALEIVRVLEPGVSGVEPLGLVEADWTRADGGSARGPVAVVR